MQQAFIPFLLWYPDAASDYIERVPQSMLLNVQQGRLGAECPMVHELIQPHSAVFVSPCEVVEGYPHKGVV